MAKKSITQLQTGSLTNNDDVFVIDTYEGTTVKIPYSALATFLLGTSLVQGSNISIVDATEQDGIKKYRISSTVSSDIRNITLTAAGWQGNSAPYTQAVTVTGITANDVPEIGLSVSNTVSTGIEETTQWGYVTKAVTSANTITFMCYETKPTIALNVIVKMEAS